MMTKLLVFLVAATPALLVQAANYRLQSTTFTVTTTTSLKIKNENCQSSFGKDAFILDMTQVQSDFNEQEFNEALTGVFFKEPKAKFYVTYDGKDSPPTAPTNEYHYAIRMESAVQEEAALFSFGNARVESWPHSAQVLCGVPSKEYQPPKAYTSPESMVADNKKRMGLGRFVFLMGIVAVTLFVRKQIIGSGMGPVPVDENAGARPRRPRPKTRSPLVDAYYSVLDQKAGGNNPFDDPLTGQELSASLTAGCELSYNPASQGLV